MTGGENEDETIGAREASSPPLMTMREHHLGLRQRRVGHGGRREGDEDATTRTTRTEEEEEEEEEGGDDAVLFALGGGCHPATT